MKELKPYRTLLGITKSLDNGGRFYNLMTRADDQVVTRGELAKAAGVFSSGDTALLFLEMSQCELSSSDQTRVSELLEPALRKKVKSAGPLRLSPEDVDTAGKAGRTVVVEGFATAIADRSMLTGMVMVPIMIGKMMTVVPVPIFEQFAMFEIRSNKPGRSKAAPGPSALLAAPKKWTTADDKPVRFGGVLRKLEGEEKKPPTHPFYIEGVYFTRIPGAA